MSEHEVPEVDETLNEGAEKTRYLLDRMKIFSKWLKRINSSNSAISNLFIIGGKIPSPNMDEAKFSPMIGIALNALDFIQIPLLYLASYLLNEKDYITPKKNAKWLYSAILLGLCVTAFVLTPIAPFIAIASASLVFAVSVYTLGSLLDERRKDKLARTEIQTAISNLDPNDTEKMRELCNQLSTIEKTISDESEVIDKCFRTILLSLSVIGAVVSLFFPPAGMLILATVTLIGTAYAIAQIAPPLFIKLGKWIKGEPKTDYADVPTDEAIHESATEMIQLLATKNKGFTDKKVEPIPHHVEAKKTAGPMAHNVTSADLLTKIKELKQQASDQIDETKTHSNFRE